MSPTGKGALRVAIEDFLHTFNLGDLVRGGVNTWIKAVEVEIANTYASFITALGVNDRLPPIMKIESVRSMVISHPSGFMTGLVIIAGTLIGGFLGLGAPASNVLRYAADRTLRTARVDPVVSFAMIYRDPSKRKELIEALIDMGYADVYLDLYEQITKPVIQYNQLEILRRRKLIDQSSYDREIKAQGWTDERIKQIQGLADVIPPVNDLISMAVRDAWNEQAVSRFQYDQDLPSEAADWASKLGLSPDWFKRYWRAHWQLPSPQMGYEMLHRLRAGKTSNPFTKEDMQLLLRIADYPTFFRDRLVEISYNPYTRVDIRRMYKLGIIDAQGVKDAYLDSGYDEEHAKNLTEFTIKYETESGTSKAEEYQKLTSSLLKSAYVKGAIEEQELRDRLAEVKYDADDIDLLVNLANLEKKVDLIPDDIKEHQSDTKKLVLAAYTARQVSRSEAEGMLRDVSLSEKAIEFNLVEADYSYQQGARADTIKLIGSTYISHAIDRSQVSVELGKVNVSGSEQASLLDEWDRVRNYRSKRLTEAQYRKALNAELITLDEYREALQGLDYTDKDIDLLVKLYPINPPEEA